ncbi:hypothetical protein [Kitasatospora fiedleri]|uniref:hypothetical protein n=1 Tax=Kitasatospora fiedleri TaxID=2991545 RepID=UPI00384B44C4
MSEHVSVWAPDCAVYDSACTVANALPPPLGGGGVLPPPPPARPPTVITQRVGLPDCTLPSKSTPAGWTSSYGKA